MAGSDAIVWVHGDCLSPRGPALLAHPGAPALWVWDDALLAEWGVSLKRVVFIYECLLELPVAIRRGDVAAELLAFAREHGAAGSSPPKAPARALPPSAPALERELPVEILPVEPLIAYAGRLDLRRFARYWQVAQRCCLRPAAAVWLGAPGTKRRATRSLRMARGEAWSGGACRRAGSDSFPRNL